MSPHTRVAAFLIACCCYGTTRLAGPRQEADRAAAAEAEAHADAHDATTPATEA